VNVVDWEMRSEDGAEKLTQALSNDDSSNSGQDRFTGAALPSNFEGGIDAGRHVAHEITLGGCGGKSGVERQEPDALSFGCQADPEDAGIVASGEVNLELDSLVPQGEPKPDRGLGRGIGRHFNAGQQFDRTPGQLNQAPRNLLVLLGRAEVGPELRRSLLNLEENTRGLSVPRSYILVAETSAGKRCDLAATTDAPSNPHQSNTSPHGARLAEVWNQSSHGG